MSTISFFDDSSILIIGGTGPLGKALIENFLSNLGVRRVAIYSRDDSKRYYLRDYFMDDPRLWWFIGDIRDFERLNKAFHNVYYVVHAAAVKQVDTDGYNPIEFAQTNILGSQNVIEASVDISVKKLVALTSN